MARKKLLTEGEVRQFMKLANLGPLSENYFTKNPLGEQDEEEFAAAEVAPEGGEEVELGAMEDEVPLDDAGLEGEEGGPAEDLVMGLLQAVQGWAEEQGVDMELDGDEEGGEEGPEAGAEFDVEEPLPGGGELEMSGEEEEFPPANMDDVGYQEGVGGADFPSARSRGRQPRMQRGTKHTGSGRSVSPEAPSAPGEPEQCVPGDDECEERQAQQQEALVAEVARRVAKRLSANKRKDQMADQLAERIFKRLTSK
jgi:hypothetical protein